MPVLTISSIENIIDSIIKTLQSIGRCEISLKKKHPSTEGQHLTPLSRYKKKYQRY